MNAAAVDFDPFSDTFFDDPYPTYRRLRDEAPVYHNAQYDFWALSRHADVSQAQKDHGTYSSAYGVDVASVQAGEKPGLPMLIMMDPPEHRRMRSLVNRVFTPRAVTALEPTVRETVTEFLNRCGPDGFDVVQDFAALFPAEIISRMLGVPEGQRQQVRLWLDVSLTREPGNPSISPEGLEASIRTGMFYYELIQERRARPADDMISDLVAAEVPAEDGGPPARLDDAEIAGFLSLLGGAGAETVTKLIGNAIVLLADHPEQWAELRADRSLVPGAVEEVLRYQAPAQYNVRRALRPVELHGTTVPEGAAVMLLVGSANRDERAFPEPDRFDIHRVPPPGTGNLGFGYGVHSCLGAALARLESRIALDALLDALPEYEVDRAGLRRVNMINVAGWSSVPVRVTA